MRISSIALFILFVLVFSNVACSAPVSTPAPNRSAQSSSDLAAVKTYLLGKTGALKTSAAQLAATSHRYFVLASDAKFDYATLWKSKPGDVLTAIQAARNAWIIASPTYEQMEGIVAGVPSLRNYDVILDAGTSGKDGGPGMVPFDLVLDDGRVLAKPGNLFGVTESALWGTDPEYRIAQVNTDFNNNGKPDFGEALPDAYILKSASEALVKYSNELDALAQQWQPNASDAFSALVVMIPTMSEYFDSWKNSRFVSGDVTTQRDFVAISRLADIQDILSSLEVVYRGIKPMVSGVDASQSAQLEKQLADLKTFVAGIYAQEQSGKHFAAEEADLLGAEAQNRATAIAGTIVQVAERLNILIVQ